MSSDLNDLQLVQRKERLRDAVCEYVDTSDVEELLEDLNQIVSEEEHDLRIRADKVAEFRYRIKNQFVNRALLDNE